MAQAAYRVNRALISPGPAQPRPREPRQVRKEAAVSGVRVCRREARVCELFISRRAERRYSETGWATDGRVIVRREALDRKGCDLLELNIELSVKFVLIHRDQCGSVEFPFCFNEET